MATNPQDDKRNLADPAALAKASPTAGKPLAPTTQQPIVEAGADGDEIVDASVVGDVAEADVEAEETSGLFGALGGIGLTAGGAAAVGAGALGVAAIGSQGDTEQNPPASDGAGSGGPTGTPLDVVLGPIADAAGGGGGGAGGPTGTPLDAVLGPVADAAGGGGGGGAGGPTGTPLDAVLGPVADAAGGGGGGGAAPSPSEGVIPNSNSPADMVTDPINDALITVASQNPGDTPAEPILGPLTNVATGEGSGLVPDSGTPLDAATSQVNAGLETVAAANPGDTPLEPLLGPLATVVSGGDGTASAASSSGGAPDPTDLLTAGSAGISSAAGGADLPVAPPSSPV